MLRQPVQLQFDQVPPSPQVPHRCAACGWSGTEVGELSSILDWLSNMPTDQPVIIPDGGCPECGHPVFDPVAQRQLVRVLTLLLEQPSR